MTAFLRDLAEVGAFPGAASGKAWFVITDERVNTEHDILLGRMNILIGFAASRPLGIHTYLMTHSKSGSTIKPIAVNVPDTFWSLEYPIEPEEESSLITPLGNGALPGWAG